jgi:hypothetical protein
MFSRKTTLADETNTPKPKTKPLQVKVGSENQTVKKQSNLKSSKTNRPKGAYISTGKIALCGFHKRSHVKSSEALLAKPIEVKVLHETPETKCNQNSKVISNSRSQHLLTTFEPITERKELPDINTNDFFIKEYF